MTALRIFALIIFWGFVSIAYAQSGEHFKGSGLGDSGSNDHTLGDTQFHLLLTER
jgi:hypothetical protein